MSFEQRKKCNHDSPNKSCQLKILKSLNHSEDIKFNTENLKNIILEADEKEVLFNLLKRIFKNNLNPKY